MSYLKTLSVFLCRTCFETITVKLCYIELSYIEYSVISKLIFGLGLCTIVCFVHCLYQTSDISKFLCRYLKVLCNTVLLYSFMNSRYGCKRQLCSNMICSKKFTYFIKKYTYLEICMMSGTTV